LKRRRQRRQRVVRPLFIVWVALAGGLYVEANELMVAPVPSVSISGDSPDRGHDPTFAMPPLDSFAEVVSRPLFMPSRRPPVAAAMSDRPSDITLIGTIISASDRRALLGHGIPQTIEHVALGQNIDGWTVKSIDPERVVLAQEQREIEVKASAKQQPIGASPPVPPHRNSVASDARRTLASDPQTNVVIDPQSGVEIGPHVDVQ
jgi:hypothetical protein